MRYILLFLIGLMTTTLSAQVYIPKFDIQGHRGARGLKPENTIPAFLTALDSGVTTLELDVVITKDKEVIVSHEPWMSSAICSDPSGKPVSEKEEKKYNMYKMTYGQIKQFDCG
ncbi:MAG: glycerophosphodiester phosphodiesterase family protein, partial [Flavobacteriales bacterium]